MMLHKSEPVYLQFIPENPTCHQHNLDKQSWDITTLSCHGGGQQLWPAGGGSSNSRAGECPSMPAGQPDKELLGPLKPHLSPSRSTPWSITSLPINTSTNHFIFSFSFCSTYSWPWQERKRERKRAGCVGKMWPALQTKEQVSAK